MSSSVALDTEELRARDVPIPSIFQLTLTRTLPSTEEAAIKAFIQYAEHLQNSKPEDAPDDILVLMHWARLLSAIRVEKRLSFAQLVAVICVESTCRKLAHDAIAYFVDNACAVGLEEATNIAKAFAVQTEETSGGSDALTTLAHSR
jgi:hypothetical protein